MRTDIVVDGLSAGQTGNFGSFTNWKLHRWRIQAGKFIFNSRETALCVEER